jgi:hypothetical protein
MKIFEGKQVNYIGRLLFLDNLVYIISMLFYSYLIFIFKPLNDFKYLLIFLLSITFLLIYFIKVRTVISKISFDDLSNLIIEGETLNKSWIKSIEIKKTKISIISNGSKIGICGAQFYLHFKYKKENFKLNYYQNFTDIEIIKIFEEFKMIKEEKIIIDEKLVINRINEKIIKCQ